MAKVRIVMEVETNEPMFVPTGESNMDEETEKLCIAENIISEMHTRLVSAQLINIMNVHSGRLGDGASRAEKDALINLFEHYKTFWEAAIASSKITIEP